MEIVSKSDLARRLGVSKARVSQLVAKGMPVTPDGKVPLTEALEWIAATTDPSHHSARVTQPPAATAPPARPQLVPPASHTAATAPVPVPVPVLHADPAKILLVAKAKRAVADAKRAERQNEIESRKVTAVDELRLQWEGLVRNAKSRLRGLGRKLAPLVAIETDATACQSVIDAAVDEALADLAAYEGLQ